MQSVIVASKDQQKREKYVETFIHEHSIDSFEITSVESETSIGIEEVLFIQKNILFKPRSGTLKAIIIKTGDNITREAQNALLKLLEEPPEHTIIILTVSSKDLLLETVCSRCKIINLDSSSFQISPTSLTPLTSLIESGVGHRLKLAQDNAKNREEAVQFLANAILSLRQKLIELSENPDSQQISKYLNILISFQRSHTLLSTTNANPRITLETLFLNL